MRLDAKSESAMPKSEPDDVTDSSPEKLSEEIRVSSLKNGITFVSVIVHITKHYNTDKLVTILHQYKRHIYT